MFEELKLTSNSKDYYFISKEKSAERTYTIIAKNTINNVICKIRLHNIPNLAQSYTESWFVNSKTKIEGEILKKLNWISHYFEDHTYAFCIYPLVTFIPLRDILEERIDNLNFNELFQEFCSKIKLFSMDLKFNSYTINYCFDKCKLFLEPSFLVEYGGFIYASDCLSVLGKNLASCLALLIYEIIIKTYIDKKVAAQILFDLLDYKIPTCTLIEENVILSLKFVKIANTILYNFGYKNFDNTYYPHYSIDYKMKEYLNDKL